MLPLVGGVQIAGKVFRLHILGGLQSLSFLHGWLGAEVVMEVLGYSRIVPGRMHSPPSHISPFIHSLSLLQIVGGPEPGLIHIPP